MLAMLHQIMVNTMVTAALPVLTMVNILAMVHRRTTVRMTRMVPMAIMEQMGMGSRGMTARTGLIGKIQTTFRTLRLIP